MTRFDLNLLRVLVVLHRTRHVGQAAQELGMSQSGFSTALNRLRRSLGDELFVRTRAGMRPTPMAVSVAESARRFLSEVERDIVGAANFDPAVAELTFRLAMSDAAEIVFMPPLLAYLAQHAPKIALQVVASGAGPLAEGLEDGTIDLAIGYLPELERDALFRQPLYEHPYACLVRKGHPVIESGLTLDAFQELGHAVVASPARSNALLEQGLAQARLHRRIAFSSPHHLALAAIVAQTHLVATVPLGTAMGFAASHEVVVLPLPVPPPRFTIYQYWHRRLQNDAANQWLRARIRALFNPATDPYIGTAEELYGQRFKTRLAK